MSANEVYRKLAWTRVDDQGGGVRNILPDSEYVKVRRQNDLHECRLNTLRRYFNIHTLDYCTYCPDRYMFLPTEQVLRLNRACNDDFEIFDILITIPRSEVMQRAATSGTWMCDMTCQTKQKCDLASKASIGSRCSPSNHHEECTANKAMKTIRSNTSAGLKKTKKIFKNLWIQ